MLPHEYIEKAKRTDLDDYQVMVDRIANKKLARLLHAKMGIVTEAGELVDALKKYMAYGRELDIVNVIEELGDLFWYIALICDELKVSFGEVMDLNIEKLKVRYPDKYSDTQAVNRNLESERNILENYGRIPS